MSKRLLSLFLALVMVLGMLPVSAFADEIPFTATLDGTACAIDSDGTVVYEEFGLELPAYVITVPADVAGNATVSLTGDIIEVATEDNSKQYEPSAVPVAFGVNYIVIGSNVMGPEYVIRFAAEQPVVTYPENVLMYYYVKESSDILSLACEMAETADEGIFEGFIYTDPDWGTNFSNYRFHADDKVYSSNGDGQYVLGEGGWNCWSSNTGMNYIVADFTTMTWSETKVTQVAVAGDFNSWSLDTDHSHSTWRLVSGK